MRDARAIRFLIVAWVATLIAAITLVVLIAKGATIARYRHDGPALLPNARLSPGQVAITDKAKLCPHADTKARRNVPRSEKLAVCLEYGISAKDCTGKTYEIDHIISLELGGSNDVSNLFPQPYLPRPGAHEKDRVENWLHGQVCTGKIPLAVAQQQIASDWYQLYLKMVAAGSSRHVAAGPSRQKRGRQ